MPGNEDEKKRIVGKLVEEVREVQSVLHDMADGVLNVAAQIESWSLLMKLGGITSDTYKAEGDALMDKYAPVAHKQLEILSYVPYRGIGIGAGLANAWLYKMEGKKPKRSTP